MSPDRPVAAARETPGRVHGILALFALVFCARAWLIRTWGSPVPYWDQWDADALALFRPWLDGTLRWSALFAAHNEHRIVLTRLADLVLFTIGGGWNIWGQLLLNAALHAAIAATVARLFWPFLAGPARAVWLLGLAVVFTMTAGWQNALWGFQSQVYFEILLSVLALAGLLGGEPFRRRWWLGWIAAVLALFALGSGLLAAITVLLISAFGLLVKRPDDSASPKQKSYALLVVFAVAALGWMLRVEVPYHAPLRAHNAMQFGAVLVRGLAWPWVNSGWLWLIMQAPMLWFTGRLLQQRRTPTAAERFALGLGVLAALHAAAVAYSRGGGLIDARPLSRYQDVLFLGVAANFFLLLQLAAAYRAARIVALGWTGILLAGLLDLTTTNLSLHLPYKRGQDAASLVEVRTYLATGDATVFTRDPDHAGPHPDPAVVRRVLNDPRLREILPAELSDPTARPPWVITWSPWLVLLSGSWLIVASIQYSRADKPSSPPGG